MAKETAHDAAVRAAIAGSSIRYTPPPEQPYYVDSGGNLHWREESFRQAVENTPERQSWVKKLFGG